MRAIENPLISIVTISYNTVTTLERTIQSVLNQTYPNIEYVIIDGGSTDGSVEVIQKYADKLSYWISEPDKGIFDAMNKGVKACNGDYIGVMNSGDFFQLDACGKIAGYMKKYPDVGVFYGDTNIIIASLIGKYKYKVTPPGTIDSNILIAPVFCHQSSFVKKSLFDEWGYFQNVRVAGDWLHFVTLYKNNVKFFYVNETMANYLDGGISTTVKGFKESFPFKKMLGTFRKKDYLTLAFFYIKDNYVFRNILSPVRWYFKIYFNKGKFTKVD